MHAFKSAIGMPVSEISQKMPTVKEPVIVPQIKTSNQQKTQNIAAKPKQTTTVLFDPKELFNFGDQP